MAIDVICCVVLCCVMITAPCIVKRRTLADCVDRQKSRSLKQYTPVMRHEAGGVNSVKPRIGKLKKEKKYFPSIPCWEMRNQIQFLHVLFHRKCL